MCSILKYQNKHEQELISLLAKEPDWSSFLGDDAIDKFKDALLESETFLCESEGKICGYLRALVDGFGIYISELYVAPQYRGAGFGQSFCKELNRNIRTRMFTCSLTRMLIMRSSDISGLAQFSNYKMGNKRSLPDWCAPNQPPLCTALTILACLP